jgi:hypothetical protein
MNTINSLSPAARMYAVYAAYGKAMMDAHMLEKQLATLLTCRLIDRTTPGTGREEDISKLKKMTMGSLITKFIVDF